MKKALLTSLLLSAFFISNAQTNVIKIDMFGMLAMNRKNISIERTFKNKFSARLSYEHQEYATGERNDQQVYELTGKGVIPEFRYYPFTKNKPAPFGFYIGSSFRYISVNEQYYPTEVDLSGNVFNYTFISGYSTHAERIVFDFLVGYGSGKVSGLDEDKRNEIDDFFADDKLDMLKANLRIEVSIGFYFPEFRQKKDKL